MPGNFVYLPERGTYLNLANVAYCNDNGDRIVEVMTTAIDCTESGFPTALTIVLWDGDRAALLNALQKVTVNAHDLVKP